MKLIYKVILRASVGMAVIMVCWAVLFYFGMTKVINDEIDDMLSEFSEQLIVRFLSGEPVPLSADDVTGQYELLKISEEVADELPQVRFEDKVVPGGVIIVNSSLIERKVTRSDVKAYYIPANDLAIRCGTARAANIVMYGAINSHCKILQPESVHKGLEYAFKKKPRLIPMNEVAYRAGFEAVEQHD